MPLTVFPSPKTLLFHFTLHNQTLALGGFAGLRWLVRCVVPAWQNMNTVMFAAKFSRHTWFEDRFKG
jgi:hypothetical protein